MEKSEKKKNLFTKYLIINFEEKEKKYFCEIMYTSKGGTENSVNFSVKEEGTLFEVSKGISDQVCDKVEKKEVSIRFITEGHVIPLCAELKELEESEVVKNEGMHMDLDGTNFCVEFIQKTKNNANSLFKDKKYQESLKEYNRMLQCDVIDKSKFPNIQTLKVTLLSNRCTNYLKLDMPEMGLEDLEEMEKVINLLTKSSPKKNDAMNEVIKRKIVRKSQCLTLMGCKMLDKDFLLSENPQAHKDKIKMYQKAKDLITSDQFNSMRQEFLENSGIFTRNEFSLPLPEFNEEISSYEKKINNFQNLKSELERRSEDKSVSEETLPNLMHKIYSLCLLETCVLLLKDSQNDSEFFASCRKYLDVSVNVFVHLKVCPPICPLCYSFNITNKKKWMDKRGILPNKVSLEEMQSLPQNVKNVLIQNYSSSKGIFNSIKHHFYCNKCASSMDIMDDLFHSKIFSPIESNTSNINFNLILKTNELLLPLNQFGMSHIEVNGEEKFCWLYYYALLVIWKGLMTSVFWTHLSSEKETDNKYKFLFETVHDALFPMKSKMKNVKKTPLPSIRLYLMPSLDYSEAIISSLSPSKIFFDSCFCEFDINKNNERKVYDDFFMIRMDKYVFCLLVREAKETPQNLVKWDDSTVITNKTAFFAFNNPLISSLPKNVIAFFQLKKKI